MALPSGAAIAQPAEAAGAQEEPRTQQELPCSEFHDKQHIVGADVDFGGGHASTGVRYLHAHREGGGCYQVRQTGWLAYGAELRTNDLDAGAAYVIGRAAHFGHSPGLALEGGVGAASDFRHSLRAAFLGFFLSFFYLEFGATYHFPIAAERPHWLASWQFAFRIHAPVFTYAAYERKYPRPSD